MTRRTGCCCAGRERRASSTSPGSTPRSARSSRATARSWPSPTAASTPACTTTSCCGRPKAVRRLGWARARPPRSRRMGSGCWPSSPRCRRGSSSIPREPGPSVGSPSIASSRSGRPTGSPTGDRSSSAGTGSGRPPAAGSSRVEGGKARAVTPAGTGRGIRLARWWGGRGVQSGPGLPPVSGGGWERPRDPGALVRGPDRSVEHRWAGARGRERDLAHLDRVDLATGRREPLVTLGTEPPGPRSRPVFFTMADDPRVYAYVAATYRLADLHRGRRAMSEIGRGHRSTTISPPGRAQQTSRFPSAGRSSGSGA